MVAALKAFSNVCGDGSAAPASFRWPNGSWPG